MKVKLINIENPMICESYEFEQAQELYKTGEWAVCGEENKLFTFYANEDLQYDENHIKQGHSYEICKNVNNFTRKFTNKVILFNVVLTKDVMKEDEINFLENCEEDYNSLKYEMGKLDDLRFIATTNEKIRGKVQQIEEYKKSITMITRAKKKGRKGESDKIYNIFIGAKYNSNLHGNILDTLNLKFFAYKTICDEEEFIVLSQKKLGFELSEFCGMKIEAENDLDLTNTLKTKSVTNIFFVYSQEEAIKKLSKKELVEYCKRYFKNNKEFKKFLWTHEELRTYFNESPEMEDLMTISQLAGDVEGYPLHILQCGPLGLGKTVKLECLQQLDLEQEEIFEASIGKFKGLIPSFADVPAKPGFINLCQRNAKIDELFKMIEMEHLSSGASQLNQRHFGAFNSILEHKRRLVGSGNNNDFKMQPTAKCIFMTNAMKRQYTLADHLNILDPSTLSRMLPIVQDEEEQKFINNNILKRYKKDEMTFRELLIYKIATGQAMNEVYKLICPKSEFIDFEQVKECIEAKQIYPYLDDEQQAVLDKFEELYKDTDIYAELYSLTQEGGARAGSVKNTREVRFYDKVYNIHTLTPIPLPPRSVSIYVLQSIYQTVFDNCYVFTIDIDTDKLNHIHQKLMAIVPRELQQGWARRGKHHLHCIFDGIVKMRCLFDDYDATFKPTLGDYERLEALAERVVKSWDCQFNEPAIDFSSNNNSEEDKSVYEENGRLNSYI